MGRTHASAYTRAAAAGFPVVLAAVADPKAHEILTTHAPAQGNLASGQFALDAASLRIHTTAEDALPDPSIDAVSICTYTDTHASTALRALAANKHVLIEKPIALRVEDVDRVRDGATAKPRLIAMPAMCMRFWPAWDWLHDRITDHAFGPLRSLTLTRLGAGPTWAAEFYRDIARSGGALFDLHIHDTDFIHHCLGAPSRVKTSGNPHHLTTLYEYESLPGVHVAAEGAWDIQPAAGFRMRYFAHFERASAEWDLAHAPTITLHEGTSTRTITPDTAHLGTGYDGEVRHFVDACLAISTRQPFQLRATMQDAASVAHTLESERSQLGY